MKRKTPNYGLALLVMLALCSRVSFAANDIKVNRDIVWSSPKGFSLTADIRVPGQRTEPAKPVLIIFHGGGWLLNTKSIMDDLASYIASHSNIITVNVNYRRLGDLQNTTTANEIVEDAMGAVLWVKDNIKKYGGDPSRLAVTGDSAGGHLAVMATVAGRNLKNAGFKGDSLGFHPSYLPKGKTAEEVAAADGLRVQAAVLSYAGFSLYTAALSGFETANNPFWQWANVKPRGLFGNAISVKTHPEFYQAVSPMQYVESLGGYTLPPQFVLVGSEDQLTPPATAEEYVTALKKHHQPVEFKIYPDRGHGFLDSGCNEYTKGCFKELAVPVVNDMISFLNRNLMPLKSN